MRLPANFILIINPREIQQQLQIYTVQNKNGHFRSWHLQLPKSSSNAGTIWFTHVRARTGWVSVRGSYREHTAGWRQLRWSGAPASSACGCARAPSHLLDNRRLFPFDKLWARALYRTGSGVNPHSRSSKLQFWSMSPLRACLCGFNSASPVPLSQPAALFSPSLPPHPRSACHSTAAAAARGLTATSNARDRKMENGASRFVYMERCSARTQRVGVKVPNARARTHPPRKCSCVQPELSACRMAVNAARQYAPFDTPPLMRLSGWHLCVSGLCGCTLPLVCARTRLDNPLTVI